MKAEVNDTVSQRFLKHGIRTFDRKRTRWLEPARPLVDASRAYIRHSRSCDNIAGASCTEASCINKKYGWEQNWRVFYRAYKGQRTLRPSRVFPIVESLVESPVSYSKMVQKRVKPAIWTRWIDNVLLWAALGPWIVPPKHSQPLTRTCLYTMYLITRYHSLCRLLRWFYGTLLWPVSDDHLHEDTNNPTLQCGRISFPLSILNFYYLK